MLQHLDSTLCEQAVLSKCLRELPPRLLERRHVREERVQFHPGMAAAGGQPGDDHGFRAVRPANGEVVQLDPPLPGDRPPVLFPQCRIPVEVAQVASHRLLGIGQAEQLCQFGIGDTDATLGIGNEIRGQILTEQHFQILALLVEALLGLQPQPHLRRHLPGPAPGGPGEPDDQHCERRGHFVQLVALEVLEPAAHTLGEFQQPSHEECGHRQRQDECQIAPGPTRARRLALLRAPTKVNRIRHP